MTSSKRKKERRHQRYLRNVRKEVEHKKEAWEAGKLIEENHNNGPYSAGYSIELGDRLYNIIQSYKEQAYQNPECPTGDNDFMLKKFRMYRMKIRDFILHYNPDIPKTDAYEYLKMAIETYWDKPDKLLVFL